MKVLTGFLLLAASACAGEAKPQPAVTVLVQADQSIQAPLLNRALVLAKLMLGGASIDFAWNRDGLDAHVLNAADTRPIQIQLRIVGEGGRAARLGALAYPLPYGSGVRSVTVLYDRIEPAIRACPGVGPALLANVIAHEIAGVLRGSTGRSRTRERRLI